MKIIMLGLLLCLFKTSFCFAISSGVSGTLFERDILNSSSDVSVGVKSNDSTGTVTISNNEIQSSIVSITTILNGYSITGEPASILANSTINYLIFKVKNASGDSLSVAVELTLVSSSNLVFRQTLMSEIHTCKKVGMCTACNFVKDRSKKIVGCFCSGSGPSSIQGEISCKHAITIGQ